MERSIKTRQFARQDEELASRIYRLRGQRVMLDRDLAIFYGISVGRLNEAVRRNLSRFPGDFMLQLTDWEWSNLKSHFAISSSGWGGRRSHPLAFTEHGVSMLASVLRSPKAVQVSIAIIRVS